MPNPQGNPEFKSKYGEKTKVIRLPESIANSIANSIALLLSQGCASSDILESLQPLSQSQHKLASDLALSDSTVVHLRVELRLLRPIKDVAKQEGTHYLQWIVNQSKKGLNLSPASPTFSEDQLTELIDQRFDSLVTNFLDSLQAQLTTYASRISDLEAQLKAQLEHNPPLPNSLPETTTALAHPTPKQITSQSAKPTISDKQTPQPPNAQTGTGKSEQKPDSNPIKLPKNIPWFRATVYTQVGSERVSIPGKWIQTGADRELE